MGRLNRATMRFRYCKNLEKAIHKRAAEDALGKVVASNIDTLSFLGYPIIEKEILYHPSDTFGKVAFWREKDFDGIVLNPIIESEYIELPYVAIGGVNAVGEAYNFLRKEGYDGKAKKEILRMNGRKILSRRLDYKTFNELKILEPSPSPIEYNGIELMPGLTMVMTLDRIKIGLE